MELPATELGGNNWKNDRGGLRQRSLQLSLGGERLPNFIAGLFVSRSSLYQKQFSELQSEKPKTVYGEERFITAFRGRYL